MNAPSKLWDLFEYTASALLLNKDKPVNEIQNVVAEAKEAGSLAIYPCNRYSRKLVSVFEKSFPELRERIKFVLDKSDNLNFMDGLPIHHLSELPGLPVDKLIVTTSKFPEDLLPDLDAMGIPRDKIIVSSLFREELSHIPGEEIIEKVRRVTGLLTDEKSKATYLLTWLSLLMLDKSILSIYFQDADMEYREDGKVSYHGMELHHLFERNIQYGIAMEIYKTDEVFPEPDDVILDIGAYRCDTVAYFRKYIGDTGAIYAFEPDAINYKFLQDNIERNRMANVHPVNKALMNGKTSCSLISTPQSGSFLFVMKEETDTTAVSQVPATTVDAFVRDENLSRVDLLKSDIEGCELEMLEGAAETVARFKPKLAIAIYHSINDLLNIPLRVHEMNPDYELFIRHRNFTGSPWEILLFAKQPQAGGPAGAA